MLLRQKRLGPNARAPYAASGVNGAMAYGTALASFNVEEFGTERVIEAALRRLLAPRWLPYRHGLDLVSDRSAEVTEVYPEPSTRNPSMGRRTAWVTTPACSCRAPGSH